MLHSPASKIRYWCPSTHTLITKVGFSIEARETKKRGEESRREQKGEEIRRGKRREEERRRKRDGFVTLLVVFEM